MALFRRKFRLTVRAPIGGRAAGVVPGDRFELLAPLSGLAPVGRVGARTP